MSGFDVRDNWVAAQATKIPTAPQLLEMARFLGRSAAAQDFKLLSEMDDKEQQHQEEVDD